MTLRDRGLIAILAVALVTLSGVTLASSFEPDDAGPGAGASGVPTRPYVEGVLGQATNASPFGARSPADRDIVALLFRGLVRLGPNETVVPDLASRWEVDPSGGVWTFHLRPNLFWDDGAPLTSDDVVFTLSVLSDPSYTGPGAASWREVTASASDLSTVVLTLDTPLAGFLQAATQPIAPAHLLDGIDPAELPNDEFGRNPVGSGPFRLTVLNGSEARLEPIGASDLGSGEGSGPNFATPRPTDPLATPARTKPADAAVPYLDGIQFRFFDGMDELLADWTAGQLDAASGIAPSDAVAMASDGDATVLRYPGTTLLAIDLDLRPQRPEFRDPAVRRALLQAINRDAIVAQVLAGLGVRADSLIPPSASMAQAFSPTPVAYDAGAAEKALMAAGWTRGPESWVPKGAKTALSIGVLAPEQVANPVAYETAKAAVADWRAIGLDARLTALPAAELLGERLHPGGFQSAVLPLAIGLDPDLYPLLASSQTRGGGANVSGLQDPSLDQLLSAARAPGADAARLAAWKALESRLDSSFYILPIAFRAEYVVLRNTVTGPTPRPVSTSGDRFYDVLTWRLLVGR
jgi:peptide/nickel transport system substrate-binding protein